MALPECLICCSYPLKPVRGKARLSTLNIELKKKVFRDISDHRQTGQGVKVPFPKNANDYMKINVAFQFHILHGS